MTKLIIIILALILFNPAVNAKKINDTGLINAELDKVTIQLKWFHQFQFAGYYASIEKGFYAEEGLDVELRQRVAGTSHIDDVLQGRAQYGVADAGLLIQRLQGNPVVLLAQIFQYSPLVLVTLADSGIREPKDLKGKRVMFDAIGYADMPLIALVLETFGSMDALEVHLKSFNPQDLIDGKIDAYDSYLTNQPDWFRQQGVAINIINPRDYGIDFYGDNLFTTEKELRERPDRVEKIRRATLKGWLYALDNRDEIIDLILEKYNAQGTNRDHLAYEARETEKLILHDLIEIGSFELDRYKNIANTYAKAGYAEETTLDPGFFYQVGASPYQIELTAEEQAWLIEHPVIKVANGMDWRPFDFNEKGKPLGYSIDIVKLMAKKIGIDLEFVNGPTWNGFLQGLKEKKLDLMHSAKRTEEREKYSLYTNPYLHTISQFVIRKDNPEIKDISDLEGKIFVAPKGWAPLEFLKENYPKIKLLETDSIYDAFNAVLLGKAVATTESDKTAQYMIAYYGFSELKTSGWFKQYDQHKTAGMHMMVRDDWPILKNLLNNALASLTVEEKRNIENKWFGDKEETVGAGITEEEQAWIAEHPVIKVSNEMDWPPFDFVEDGLPTGFSIDYLTLVAEKVGLGIEWINGYTWNELEEMGRMKKLDLLQSISSTPEKETNFNFTKPYVNNPKVIFAQSNDVDSIGSLKDLAGKRVSVIEGFSHHLYIKEHHPEIKIIPVKNIVEGLTDVIYGKADAYIDRQAVINYAIKENNLSGVQYAAMSGHHFLDVSELAFAVRDDWPLLVSIIEKGMSMVTEEEYEAISRRWFIGDNGLQVNLTEQERDWLNNHLEITLGFTAEIEPLLIVGEDGQLSGILKDIYDELESATGIKINIEIDEWSSTIRKAKDGEIDGLLVSASSLAENAGLIYSHILTTGNPTVFAKKDAPFEINSEKDLEGKKISILKGIYVVEEALEPYKDSIEIIKTESALEMMKMVLEGKVDAAYGLSYHNYLISKHMLIGIEPVYFTHKIDANGVASIREEWPEFISIMNKVLDTIGRDGINKINQKWTQLETKPILDLTPEERAWIDTHQVINMCVDPDWMPFGQINEDGEHEGVVSEYMDLISKRLGVHFELYPTEDVEESLVKVSSGECMVLSSGGDEEWIKSPGLLTQPYMKLSFVFAIREDKPFIRNLQMIANDHIGVVATYPTERILKNIFPDKNLALVENVEQGVWKVASGEIDTFASTLSAISYSIQEQKLRNVKIGGVLPGESPVHIVVHEKDPILVSILDKAIDSITQEDRMRIADRWFSVSFERGFDYTLLWQILAVVTVVLALFLYWNRRLAMEIAERKKAEQRLMMTQYIVDHINDSVLWVNPDSSFFYANETSCFRLGYTQQEILNLGVPDIDPNYPVEEWPDFWSKLKNEATLNFETTHITKNGRMIPVEITATYLIFGNREFVCAVLHDISERKQAEEALAKSEARFRGIFEQAAVGVALIKTPTGRFVRINQRYCDLVGYSSDEMMEMTFQEITHPDDLEADSANMQRLITNEINEFNMEIRYIRKDGSLVWLNLTVSPTWNPGEQTEFHIAIAEDITARKQTEEELRNAKEAAESVSRELEFVRYAVDHSVDMAFWPNVKDGRLFYVNEAASKRLGYTQDELLNMYVPQVDKGIPPWPEFSAKLMLEGALSFETYLRAKNGDYLPVEVTAKFVEFGNEQRFIAFARDITQRKKAEKALEQAKVNAESANQAKSTFLANMSHEIRTPMNTVLGFTEILKREESDKNKIRYIEHIYLGGQALLSLINDILDLSKVEAGKLELQYSAVSIDKLLTEIKVIFEHKIIDQGLEFIIEKSKSVPKLLILDETRIRQVLINLLGNAVKFTNSGFIRLSVSVIKTEITTSSRVNLSITIEDSGIGIPEDQCQKVFNAFEQVKGQKTKDYGGTGLGLAITKRLVEMMNGEIRVESIVGKGASFHIDLNNVEIASGAEVAETEKILDIESIFFDPASILIVDDIDYNRELLASYLKEWEFSFIEAGNGVEALAQAGKHKPNLILLDMKMPEMDGYEMCEHMHKDENLKDIPVIAVTASALKQDEEVISKLCDGYLRKPVSRTDLVRELMKHLPHTIEEAKEDIHLQETTSAEMILPSSDKVERLIYAAETGSVTELNECIADIKAMGLQYQPFVDKIESLSHIFQFDEIVEFLEKHVGKA